MSTDIKDLQHYGVGVEWSFDMEGVLEKNLQRFQLLEVIPENFFRQGQDFLKSLQKAGTPTIIHGVELSFGSDEPLKQRHLDEMLEVADQVNTVMISEHLSMTESGGVEIGQLTPLPWTQKAVDLTSYKIDEIRKQLTVPFAIENVTNRFMIPHTELSETEFINKILANTGCGLQLDLNNIDTNAYNFGFDPIEWLDEIDLSQVVSVHLAGGVFDDEGTLLDSHNAPVRNRVWDMYSYVCQRITPSSTVVEWTDNCPPLEVLLDDVRQAQKILGTFRVERGETDKTTITQRQEATQNIPTSKDRGDREVYA